MSCGALQPTTAARPYSQILLTTNAGDSQSVVLNGLREIGAVRPQQGHRAVLVVRRARR